VRVDLVLPSDRYRTSYLAAQQELGAEAKVTSDAAFTAMLDDLVAARTREATATRVPSTTLWLVEHGEGGERGDEFLGRLSIRHALNDALRVIGGHIGYEVRPSRRGQGLGTLMLALALPRAKALGVDPAMLTCDADNDASWRMIERAGGTRVDEYMHQNILRYRYSLPTS
jgi:predicted acetyltransferase